MLKKNKLRLGVVATLAVAGMAFGTVAASADPNPAGFKSLNGVGSDTIQDVMNGLSTVIPSIGSYDAQGTATIQTTAGGNAFKRPDGSGQGQQALSAAADTTGAHLWNSVNIVGQVDFARSSSGPDSSLTGTDLTFIPFAKDAVTFAVNSASDFPRDIAVGNAGQDSLAVKPFTLRNIYRCAVTTFPDAFGDPVTITPLLPQAGSGTRKFFLSTIGLSETQVSGCATDTVGGVSVQEHDGNLIRGAGAIVPFSVAQYLSQSNYKTLPTAVDERRGVIDLGRISSVKPILLSNGVNVLNTAFPVTRSVYNVVQTSRLAEPAIAAAFVGSTSSVCANPTIIRNYGFAPLTGVACGTTTAKQGFKY
jgi:hypothetical protein